jgi:hypothetical protein
MLTPRFRPVSSRTSFLNRSIACGASRRFGSQGGPTALFASFTRSLSFFAMERFMPSITPSAARRLRT